MPYYKRYGRGRRRGRRRRYTRKRYSRNRYVTAKKSYAIAKKAIVDEAEAKVWPLVGELPIGDGAAAAILTQDLTGILQGDDDTRRIGNKVHFSSLQVRGKITSNSQVPTVARILIFQWMGNNAVDSPQLGDILDLSLLGDSTYIHAPYRTETSQLYQMLWDKTFSLNPMATGTASITPFMTWVRAARNSIEYNADGSAFGVGHIYYIIFGNSSTNPSSIEILTRFRYRDL